MADALVASVLRAIELLDTRVRGATKSEIGSLAHMEPSELEHALSRATVGGWASRVTVMPDTERPGARTGDVVYQLTEMGHNRAA